MAEPSISDLKAKKEEIVKDVSSLITKFQLEYGVMIKEINLDHTMPSEGTIPKKTTINLKIEIV